MLGAELGPKQMGARWVTTALTSASPRWVHTGTVAPALHLSIYLESQVPREPRYIQMYHGDHLVAVQTFLDHKIWGCVLGVMCVMIALFFGGPQRGVWDREEAVKGK